MQLVLSYQYIAYGLAGWPSIALIPRGGALFLCHSGFLNCSWWSVRRAELWSTFDKKLTGETSV